MLDVVYRPGEILASYLSGHCVHSVAALEKECRRLGLPKMDHPLVEQDQVSRVGNTVHIAGQQLSPRGQSLKSPTVLERLQPLRRLTMEGASATKGCPTPGGGWRGVPRTGTGL